MTAITFDTLKFVDRLRAAGIPEAQAKAIAEAMREAQGEAELATVRDLRELGEITRHEIEAGTPRPQGPRTTHDDQAGRHAGGGCECSCRTGEITVIRRICRA